jgi:hypothetical protein
MGDYAYNASQSNAAALTAMRADLAHILERVEALEQWTRDAVTLIQNAFDVIDERLTYLEK